MIMIIYVVVVAILADTFSELIMVESPKFDIAISL